MTAETKTPLLCLILSLASWNAGAAQRCDASLEGLLAQRANPAYGRYAYDVVTTAGETRTMERFDPSLPDGQRWRLFSVDGQAPTKKHLERAGKHRAGAQEGFRFHALFDAETLGSIQPLELGSERQRYSFTPAPSPDDDEESRAFTREMQGELIFEQGPDCLIDYRLDNSKPFKPVRGVKVKTFSLRIRLRPLESSGVFYPSSMQQTVTGKALLVKTIDQRTEASYSGYAPVMPE